MNRTSRSDGLSVPVTRRQAVALGGSVLSAAAFARYAAPTPAFAAQLSGDIGMWTFFDQVEIAAEQFMTANSGVKMEVQVFPGDQYETKMRLALQNDQDAPDLFDTDLGYQGKYINGPFMEDLSAMGAEGVIADYMPYLQAFSKDANGVVRAIIDHSAPGGFWYRRDLAEQYMGTGVYSEVTPLVDSWDKIIELGTEISAQSGDSVHLLDSYNAVLAVEQYHMEPWVVDGKLTIDERWNEALDAARRIRENNVDAKLDAFSAPWGSAWNNGSVLMFAWPAWASFLIDPAQTGDTWGVAKAPKPYYGGGRFSSIYTKSDNKELSFEYLKFVASAEWQQYNLESTLNMPALKSVYESNLETTLPLFGDQPILATYSEIAQAIPERPLDEYGEAIGSMFTGAVSDMIREGQTNEDAFNSLKEQVKSAYPDLQVD
jgi:multiple sugar transport system substrate-binding protein